MSASTESPLGARVSRAELVARELEREIADGLNAGHRLGTKDDLRRRFRVAVATLNEAMRLLEMRGLIEARPGPGCGVFVARPAARIAMSHVVFGFRTGTTSYEECLELRDALEPLVDSHAARYHRTRDIRELKRILRSMEASVNDSAAFIKCNWALHRRIAEICRNGPLRHMYLALIDFLEFSIDRAELSDFDGAAIEAHQPRAATRESSRRGSSRRGSSRRMSASVPG